MDGAVSNLNTVDQLQVAIAFGLYSFVFGWIGFNRGWTREAWVFGVAFLSVVFLRLQGDLVIRIVNLAWRLVQAILQGGLSESGISSSGTTNLITPCPIPQTVPPVECNSSGFLFLLWVFIVIVTYLITNKLVSPSPSNGWAIVLGLMNGLLYASIFLPRLLALFRPDLVQIDEPIIFETMVGLLRTTMALVANVLSSFWTLVEPIRPFVILAFLILLVVGAASTLRGARA
jgi:hypothetical protein